MKQILSNLSLLGTNLHVSWPVIGAAILSILPVWLPQYSDRIKESRDILLAYGILAAANTAPTPKPPTP